MIKELEPSFKISKTGKVQKIDKAPRFRNKPLSVQMQQLTVRHEKALKGKNAGRAAHIERQLIRVIKLMGE